MLLDYFPYAVSAWILLIGLYGIVTSRNLIHLVICLSVVQSATYILILSVGYRTNASAPIFSDLPLGTPAVDPVVHALTLTDIVVGAAVTALLLAITIRIYEKKGTIDPLQLHAMMD
jgi:multicomponent Na+:H+ antiporter subunit C